MQLDPHSFLVNLLHLSPSKMEPKSVKGECETNKAALIEIRNELNALNLSSLKTDIREGLILLHNYEDILHRILNHHFEKTTINYLLLYSTVGSSEVRDLILIYLDKILKEVEIFEQGEESKTNDLDYICKEFNSKVLNFKEMYNTIKEANQHTQDWPNLDFNMKIFQNLHHSLQESLSSSLYYDMQAELEAEEHGKIIIDTPNYFTNDFKQLVSFNDEYKSLAFLNLKDFSVRNVELNTNSEFPYSPSIIATPEPRIFLTGGVFPSNGYITNKMFEFMRKENGNVLSDLEPMKVKKVGHSLCYVVNEMGSFIYCVGGKTNQTTRTKICERYIINENRWERIANLNYARSRAAVCQFKNKTIYAFYGTNSENKNVKIVEKYSIETDQWSVVPIYNDLIGIEVSFAGAVQINENQILIFGGFHEGITENHIIPSKKIMTFNVCNETLRILKNKIPIDFCLEGSYSPVIQDNTLYAIGFFFKNSDKNLRCTDYCYALSMKEDDVELKSIISLKTRKARKESLKQN